MPGFTPADGDLLQIKTCCYVPNQISLNVLHYQQFSHVGAGLTLLEIAFAFEAAVSFDYKSLMSPDAKWRGVSAMNLMDPATIEYPSIAGDGVGIAPGSNLPTQTSLLVTLKTQLRGRRYIGHYYPGFPSTTFAGVSGAMNAGGLAAVTALAAAMGPTMVLTVGANSVTLYAAVRHPDAVVLGVKIPQWTTVFNVVPSPLFATQRRRGQFGRENLPPF